MNCCYYFSPAKLIVRVGHIIVVVFPPVSACPQHSTVVVQLLPVDRVERGKEKRKRRRGFVAYSRTQVDTGYIPPVAVLRSSAEARHLSLADLVVQLLGTTTCISTSMDLTAESFLVFCTKKSSGMTCRGAAATRPLCRPVATATFPQSHKLIDQSINDPTITLAFRI